MSIALCKQVTIQQGLVLGLRGVYSFFCSIMETWKQILQYVLRKAKWVSELMGFFMFSQNRRKCAIEAVMQVSGEWTTSQPDFCNIILQLQACCIHTAMKM